MANIKQEWLFNNFNYGSQPTDWYGGCVVTSGGMLSSTNCLSIGDSNRPLINVVAPAPRADAVMPKTFEEAWSITYYFKSKSYSGCFQNSEIKEPITLMSMGSMDRDEKLKVQLIPNGDGTVNLMVYPFKTNIRGDDCLYHYVNIKAWDSFFNVYIDNNSVPIIQYGVPGVAPFWKAGENRIQVTFPVDAAHIVLLDSYKFETTSIMPSSSLISSGCYLIKDSSNTPAVNSPVFLIPVTSPANQTTTSMGRFCLSDIPDNTYVMVVYPNMSTALISPSDVTLAKKRKALSGADDCCNTVIDSLNQPVSGARIYYLPTTPNFYTDTEGKLASTSVPAGYNVFIRSGDNGSLYLDSSLFS